MCFSLLENMPFSMDKFMIFARGLDIMVYYRERQKLISFLISNSIIGSKRNDDKGDGSWRSYASKCCC